MLARGATTSADRRTLNLRRRLPEVRLQAQYRAFRGQPRRRLARICPHRPRPGLVRVHRRVPAAPTDATRTMSRTIGNWTGSEASYTTAWLRGSMFGLPAFD